MSEVDSSAWAPESVVTPRPVVDRVETELGVVVMVESGAAHRIVRLSQLGAEVLTAVDGGTTIGALESAMLDRLGPPPGGDLSHAVRDAVSDLVGAGLLSVT